MADQKENKAIDPEEMKDQAGTAAEAEETAQTEEPETAAEEASEAAAEEADTGKKEKKGFFGKKKPDPKDEQIAELKDRLMRQMAEFDNYRKRTDKEKTANYEIGASDFIQKILPVMDNFERGLEGLSEEEAQSSFAQGIQMVYKQMAKVLEDAGVEVIEAKGKEFDPMLHNAVMQQPSEEYESGTVIQEFQKGYKYKDRVIRHSMVIVAE